MELKPAHSLSLDQLAALFNDAFTNYVGGNVQFTAPALAHFIANDNIDLDLSQVFFRDDQPIGFGHVTRQGWTSRLAAFGIIPSASHAGLGKAAMLHLIDQARARGDHVFELEVIEQNPRAVRLYAGVGFQTLRRLVGYELKSPPVDVGARHVVPEIIDILDAARVVVEHGAPDLPWGVAGAALARHAPPDLAFCLDDAYAVISNPAGQVVAFRAVIVPPDLRRQGRASRLISALFARYPDKTWVVPAIVPEEIGGELLARFGFTRQPISQFQMRLAL